MSTAVVTKRRRILLIEDDDFVARLIGQCLPEMDFTMATSARDAIMHAHAGGFSAIVLDLNLPDSKGAETVRLISTVIPGTPIVVTTGITNHECPTAAVTSAGAQIVLRKPIDPEELREALIQVIAPKEVGDKYDTVKAHLENLEASARDREDRLGQAVSVCKQGEVPRVQQRSGSLGTAAMSILSVALATTVAAWLAFGIVPRVNQLVQTQEAILESLARQVKHEELMEAGRQRERKMAADILVQQAIVTKLLKAKGQGG